MGRSSILKQKIVPLDPQKARTLDALVTALGLCSFQGRALSQALGVWEQMAHDKNCLRVMSLAGAMVPAGMGLIIVRLIERGLLDALICTGATLSHDLCNTVAADDQAHYIGSECADDAMLRDKEVNRIYDTYLSEYQFVRAEYALLKILPRVAFPYESETRRAITTSDFCRQIGSLLPGHGILTAAATHGVAIFVPAISDSELGLNIVTANAEGRFGPKRTMEFDTLGDVEAFGDLIASKPRAGLISIGGGVPRNWAQQVYPYLNMKVQDKRVKAEGYHYGVRITTDRPEFGGLSGCTISESKSWGKYKDRAVDASVICDATIALPLLAGALLERLDKGKRSKSAQNRNRKRRK